jgi:hypothetical protein
VHRRGVKRRIEHKSTDHSQLEPRRSEKAIKMEKKWRLHGYLNRDHLFFLEEGRKKVPEGKKAEPKNVWYMHSCYRTDNRKK